MINWCLWDYACCADSSSLDVLLADFQKLVPNPSLIVDGVSRFDFAQGVVGKISIMYQMNTCLV